MESRREVITSPQNKYVSLARGLANKKNREKEKLFRFDGVKLMCEALKRGVKFSFILASDKEWDAVIEKAEKAYDAKKAAEMEEKLRSNKFTLQDFYEQMVQMKSMGSMQDILAQMPGGANLKNVNVDEKAMAHTEAIILSMTPKERENPNIIGASRKKRIAAGCGLKVEDVNRLLKSFEQMQKLIKQFSGPGAGKKMKRMSRMGGFGGGFPGF